MRERGGKGEKTVLCLFLSLLFAFLQNSIIFFFVVFSFSLFIFIFPQRKDSFSIHFTFLQICT